MATTSSGRSAGRPASSSCQCTGRPGRAAACRSRRARLVSTRWIVIAAPNSGTTFAASQGVGHQRAASRAEFHDGAAAGPAEIQPMLDQGQPISSPNSWLTSGAVTKSPALPKGSRRG